MQLGLLKKVAIFFSQTKLRIMGLSKINYALSSESILFRYEIPNYDFYHPVRL